MPKIHLPDAKEIGSILSPLAGKTTRVAETGRPHSFEDTCQTARYVTRDDQLGALIQADLRLAAILGAALAMMPPVATEEAIANKALCENLTDAYCEVANIMAGLLCNDSTPHVRWTEIESNTSALTDADKKILDKPCERIDVEIEIESYGSGHLSIMTAKLD